MSYGRTIYTRRAAAEYSKTNGTTSVGRFQDSGYLRTKNRKIYEGALCGKFNWVTGTSIAFSFELYEEFLGTLNFNNKKIDLNIEVHRRNLAGFADFPLYIKRR